MQKIYEQDAVLVQIKMGEGRSAYGKFLRAKAREEWQGEPLPQCCSAAHMLLVIWNYIVCVPLLNKYTCTCPKEIQTCLTPSVI